jgi:hypothetical protein
VGLLNPVASVEKAGWRSICKSLYVRLAPAGRLWQFPRPTPAGPDKGSSAGFPFPGRAFLAPETGLL